MTALYAARGNRYVVASPAEVRRRGVALPATPDAAAKAGGWMGQAIDAFCRVEAPSDPVHPFRSDGLLIGPFETAAPFSVLIVNTDGTLAERSGNGLTIFATALHALAIAPTGAFDLNVCHAAGVTTTRVRLADREGHRGVWLDMGKPMFGAAAVGALETAVRSNRLVGREVHTVFALAAIDSRWTASQFVRLGNPHCVTLLAHPTALPTWDQLRDPKTAGALGAIANLGGSVCPGGVNLQWAAQTGDGQVSAVVFERGEGATLSSGTSACAVAAAALRVGWIMGPEIEIVMPGGVAPVLAEPCEGGWRIRLFGEADQVPD